MLNFEQLDHEFMTEGNPDVGGEEGAALIQKNLTPEEQDQLKKMMPMLEEASALMYKAQNGEFPPSMERMASINAPEDIPRGGFDTVVPGSMQNETMAPPRAVQENAPEIAPKTMSMGDKVKRATKYRKMALGDSVQPVGNPGDVAAGPVGVVAEPGADNSGVADDVPAKSDGFVINAAAVRHAGLKDINEMIQSAKEYAEQKGIELDFGEISTGAEDILVSNGEVVIPDALARIIGYDKLEKINNRGKEETEEKLAAQEEGAPPEGPPLDTAALPPVLQDQMAGLT